MNTSSWKLIGLMEKERGHWFVAGQRLFECVLVSQTMMNQGPLPNGSYRGSFDGGGSLILSRRLAVSCLNRPGFTSHLRISQWETR